jgi:hypothetical protein
MQPVKFISGRAMINYNAPESLNYELRWRSGSEFASVITNYELLPNIFLYHFESIRRNICHYAKWKCSC